MIGILLGIIIGGIILGLLIGTILAPVLIILDRRRLAEMRDVVDTYLDLDPQDREANRARCKTRLFELKRTIPTFDRQATEEARDIMFMIP